MDQPDSGEGGGADDALLECQRTLALPRTAPALASALTARTPFGSDQGVNQTMGMIPRLFEVLP